MADRKTVDLYYDTISPYAWLGFEILTRYRTRWNIDLKLKPVFQGGIMAGSGNKPPGIVPRKGAYLVKDLERLREYCKVPINNPSDTGEALFVKGSLNAQRFLTAVDMHRPDKTEAVSRELWMRIWSRDEDITLPDSLRQVGQLAGLSEKETEELLTKMKDQSVKDRLKLYTSQCLDEGAFGVPTIVVHKGDKTEMVFGSDRFPVLANILGERWEGPLPELAKCKL